MVVAEIKTPQQFGFLGADIFVPSREMIKVGEQASVVVSRILNAHNIKTFSYTKFNPESTYPMDANQPFWWEDWSGGSVIKDLSQGVYEDSLEVFEIEGDKIVICEILGIGSRVKTKEGLVKHMRMLDFANFSEVNIDKIKDINLPRGVLLKTDRSFHYYGLDLVTEEGWRVSIENLMKITEGEELFELDYLPMCLKRGYSALRVFGYKDTAKEKTPVVVARI